MKYKAFQVGKVELKFFWTFLMPTLPASAAAWGMIDWSRQVDKHDITSPYSSDLPFKILRNSYRLKLALYSGEDDEYPWSRKLASCLFVRLIVTGMLPFLLTCPLTFLEPFTGKCLAINVTVRALLASGGVRWEWECNPFTQSETDIRKIFWDPILDWKWRLNSRIYCQCHVGRLKSVLRLEEKERKGRGKGRAHNSVILFQFIPTHVLSQREG